MSYWFVLSMLLKVGLVASGQVNKDTPGWFEFVVPGLDASATPVDMAFLNSEPAGAGGFVRIQDGHVVDAQGRRLRFLGTNFTFGTAFPDKSLAPQIAAHLRKLGINIVRFHHMDNSVAPRGIWAEDQETFDPEQVDRLDWIIYQLKQHGIYTNLNLHVSRNYPGVPRGPRTFIFGKVLDHFHRPYIEMQKEYARLLLTHRNPYTGNRYVEEPAVAFVEINNENTLLRHWQDLLELPEPFRSDLQTQWNAWLRRTYGSTQKLRQAWDVVREPLGTELLRNRDFATGTAAWYLEQDNTAKGRLEISDDAPRPGMRSLHVITLQQGEQSWNLQLQQRDLDLENGAPYTLSFWAKSDAERSIHVGVRLQQAPWHFVGLQKTIRLTPDWEYYTFTFQVRDTLPKRTRLNFDLRNQIGHFWFADLSLRRGGTIGLPEGQSLEEGTVALPSEDAPAPIRRSMWEFLRETEMRYSEEMVRFLKEELGVRALVSVTQASYGGIAGVYREATLSDYVDMHSYWQHPHFPRQPWSRTDWDIPNTSMVNDPQGGTLSRLAAHRVQGMPFTVSEYDHPAPNDHAAEMFPMIASFAAFQDWDAVYQFSYGGHWDTRRMLGYFALNGHPGKLVFLPVAAVMYRMGGVSPASQEVILQVPEAAILDQLVRHGTNARAAWAEAGAPPWLPIAEATAVAFVPEGALSLSQEPPKETDRWVSRTEEIIWDRTDPERGIYLVNSARVRAAVGYLGGRRVGVGNFFIEMEPTETNWASIALAALDGKPLERSARVLLVAVGRVENTNMGWNADRTSVGDQWGTEPTVAEGIPATLTLREMPELRVQALDGTGAPKAEVAVQAVEGGIRFRIGPEYQTLWYLLTP